MTRFELKQQAKDALRDNFGSKMLLFIIPIIWGILSNVDRITGKFNTDSVTSDYDAEALWATFVALIISLIISFVITLIIEIIKAAAVFNYIKIFRGERSNPQFSNVFIPFRDGSGWKIVLLILLESVFMILLIFIPIIGWILLVYFGLGWSQATYVLYDQLENGTYRGPLNVLRESSQLMSGRRGDYFIFWISFIGWYILSWLTYGLVGFYTTPYINMAMIAYYEELRYSQN